MKGSVIKRGSKCAVVVDAGRDANGNRVRKWHSGYATKKAPEEAQVEILSRMQRGEYVAPNKTTVGDWLAVWVDCRTGIADTTRDGYEREVKRLTKAFGSQRLRDLTTATISLFYASLTEAGLSPKTVKNCHSVLH